MPVHIPSTGECGSFQNTMMKDAAVKLPSSILMPAALRGGLKK